MDTNISHEVEARLRRIEDHVGLKPPGEEDDGEEATEETHDE